MGSLLRHEGSFSCSIQTLSCGMWDLLPRPGIKPGPPALRAGSLSHWTTREVLKYLFYCGGLEPNLQYRQDMPVCVLVSYCCYKKLLQVSWLKTTQMCYLTVLEVKKSKMAQLSYVPSGGSRGESTSLPFLAPGGCLHSLACGSVSLQPVLCLHFFSDSLTSHFPL